MINLLISSDSEMWESNTALLGKDRCLTEYIMTEFRSRFSSLGEDEIRQLLEIPAIFAYEQYNRKDAYVGRIKNITR